MSAEEKQNEIDLSAFEAALASLVPRADRLDRDRLMFLAGQHSRTGFQPVITRIRSNLAWAWPAAFSAMTTVTAVLAILLFIRPAIPTMDPNFAGIAANAKSDKTPLPDLARNHFPVQPIKSENDPADKIPSTSPLIAYLQLFWKSPNPGKAAEAGISASDSASYPQLRDRVLHQGIDSWRIAQTFPSNISLSFAEPPSNRDLLKEYLSEMK